MCAQIIKKKGKFPKPRPFNSYTFKTNLRGAVPGRAKGIRV